MLIRKLNVANTWQSVKIREEHLGGKVQLLFYVKAGFINQLIKKGGRIIGCNPIAPIAAETPERI